MGRIPDTFVQDLLARADLVEIIGEKVTLKKSGRNYMACCPFHGEKTPSFSVSPDKQFYYCFGCGAKGNAIGFLMDHDHATFPDAVEQLASRLGMDVPTEERTAQSQQRQTHVARLFELLERADLYYRRELKQGKQRQIPVDYLKSRGLSGDIAARYGLGFAPPGFDNLMTALSLDETGLALALDAGLLVRREDTGRIYDKFRDRIMFPIRDLRGRTLGFGGRVLGDGKPKYLNSPETPVFSKGQELYGLWEWRQSRDKASALLVVEGYMDVIAMAQYGIPNVVATLGTATSAVHVQKLFRHVDEVIFCFDGDAAGRGAAWRALESTLPCLDDGKQARFLFLREGEDPDTLVRREGREALLAEADKAPTLSAFLFQHLVEGLNLNTIDGRARLARLALPYLQRIQGRAYQRLLRRELAQKTHLREDELQHLQEGLQKKPSQNPPKTTHNAAPATRLPPATAVRYTLVDRLLLAILQQPDLCLRHPLPDDIEELNLPRLDLLIDVVTTVYKRPDTSHAELTGRLLAIAPGELIAELMVNPESMLHEAETRETYWQDGLKQLAIRLLEQRLHTEEQQPSPDITKLAALGQELARVRNQ